MVGLKIRPVAKLNHNRTEVLPPDGKEDGGEGESKRERTRECIQLYAPLIER